MAISQGGGGGRASNTSASENYALDKPYDVTGVPSLDKQQYIDEMLQYLFHATKQLKAAVGAAGAGNVVGPSSAVDGDIALYDGVTGRLIKDGAKLGSDLVTGPASVTDGHVAVFNGVTGKIIKSGNFALSSTLSSLYIISGTLTDAQMKAALTPVTIIATADVPAGYAIMPAILFFNGDITVNGAVGVNMNVRWIGTAQNAFPNFTAIAAGTNGFRHHLDSPSFNIQTATDYAVRGIEIVGTANAGGTFATLTGKMYFSIIYGLVAAD